MFKSLKYALGQLAYLAILLENFIAFKDRDDLVVGLVVIDEAKIRRSAGPSE